MSLELAITSNGICIASSESGKGKPGIRVTTAVAQGMVFSTIPHPSSLTNVCFQLEYARRKYLKNSFDSDLHSSDTGDNYTAAKRLHRE